MHSTAHSLPSARAGSHYQLLGFLAALPLSIIIEAREFLPLHLLIFVPLSLLTISRGPRHWTGLTGVDRLAISYFLWGLLSLLINLLVSVWSGDGAMTVPRLSSWIATLMYAVLPFVIGRLLFETDHELSTFLHGLMIGALATTLLLSANYALTWIAEREMARYAIGQRVVVGMCFLSMILIFVYPLRFRVYAFLFLIWLVVTLSATRATFLQLGIGLLLVLFASPAFRKTQRVMLALIAAMAVLVGSFVGDAALRVEWLLEPSPTGAPTAIASEDHSSVIRLLIWDAVASKVFQDLSTGILGFGQLGPAYITDRFAYKDLDIELFSAHSEYLDQVVRAGVVGLALLLALCAKVIVASFRCASRSRSLAAYRGVAIGLIGVAFYSLFHESIRYPWFGVMFWLLVGGLSNVQARARNVANHAAVAVRSAAAPQA